MGSACAGTPSPGQVPQQPGSGSVAPVLDANAIQNMFQTLLSKLGEQEQRQQVQAVELHQRLSRLEGAGAQQTPLVPPVSHPPGLGVSVGYPQVVPGSIPPPPPLPDPSSQFSAGGKLDTKWLPNMPLPQYSHWKTRLDEVHYFWSWIEQLSSWLALLHPSFLGEIREVMMRRTSLKDAELNPDQIVRAQRVFHILKQSFQGYRRVEHLVQAFEAEALDASSGYELLRVLRNEFNLHSRAEALAMRRQFLELKISRYDDVHNLMRQIDVHHMKFQKLIGSFQYPQMVTDLQIPESDMYLLIMRNLPNELKNYVKFHSGETVSDLRAAIKFYHSRSRMLGTETEKVKALHEDPKGKGKDKEKGKEKGKRKGKAKGKGSGKQKHDKGKGDAKNREKSSGSSANGKGSGSGKDTTCWRCGKSGHMSKDCPDKAKDKDKKCTRCGKKGHLKEQCRVKLRQLNDSSGGQDSADEPASEPGDDSRVFMVFRHECLPSCTESDPVAISHDVLESHTVSKAVSQKDGSFCWLVDSGATSHIVSKRFVSMFKVVKDYPGSRVELRAANQQVIETFGLVDLEVRFQSTLKDERKVRPFVLSRCIVADTLMNVISPFVLSGHGWRCEFDSEDSCLLQKSSGLRVPMSLRERAWFADASVRAKRATSPRRSGPQPMDVSSAVDVSNSVEKPSCLKKSTPPDSANVSMASSTGPLSFQVGNLTFLYRGFSSKVVDSSSDGSCTHVSSHVATCCALSVEEPSSSSSPSAGASESQDCSGLTGCFPREMFGETGDEEMSDGEPVYQPLPGLDEPLDDSPDSADFDEPSELDMGPDNLYEHLSQGHQPFLSSCLSCCRAAGRVPARRMRSSVNSKSQVGADFGFFGQSVKFLVIVAIATGMMGVVPMSIDSDVNLRCLNRVLRDVGMTGRDLEVISDGELAVQSMFRSCSKLDTFPGTGIHYRVASRSQSNGVAERAIGTVKQIVAAHILFLESRVSRRIPMESPIVGHLLKYVSHTYNIHAVHQGSTATALDKLRGHIQSQRPRTLPFGVVRLGRLLRDSRVNQLEKFSKIVYLGPQASTGGKVLGILAGESRVGLSEEEWFVVRNFQVVKFITPCEWSADDLACLIFDGPELPLPTNPIDVVDPDGSDEKVPGGSKDRSGPIIVPTSGPPRAWLDANGLTPGCYGCKGISQKGTARGRVHSKACKKRYEEYLRRRIEEQDRDEEKDDIEPPAKRRIKGKTTNPPGYDDDAHPRSVDPGVPAVVPGPVVPAAPNASSSDGTPDDVEMDEPAGDSEPMELELIVHNMMVERETAFLRGWSSGSGSLIWFKSHCFGKVIYQGFKEKEVCEISGKLLDHAALRLALSTEHEQLTKLEVGEFLPEQKAKLLASQSGTRVISTRWVIVQKPDRVRARLVCRDYRSSGLSSLRENIYAPTSSLDCLRLIISIAEQNGFCLLTSDVSTAFLFAPLFTTEVVCFPPDMVGENNERLYVKLKKALYGLRKAPLAWFRELKSTLIDLGLEETSEPTMFRGRIQGSRVFLLIYVDDLIMVGSEKTCETLFMKLSTRYQIKVTGKLLPGTTGMIQFLGRNIFRAEEGCLRLGLPPSYFDEIEVALGESVKVSLSPPNLTRFEKVEDSDLRESDAKRFRSVLGRLAWVSLTSPQLLYYVSWCATYQTKPTNVGLKGLVEAVRFGKSFRCHSQSFGHEGPHSWAPDDHVVKIIVDASWGLRSVMGGVILFNHTYIKGWSRKIQTTCLSSGESELHAIAEGCKEAMAFGILAESLLYGLPSKDSFGIYVRTQSTLKMALWTDSESSLHTSQMNGLLRRIRHLELRVQLIQELVDHDRLSVHYIPGSQNGSDFLTKCSDRDHLQHLLWMIGSEESDYERKVSHATDDSLSHLNLSSQNRRRVQEGIEVTVRKILDEAIRVVPSVKAPEAQVRKVHFGETEIRECENVLAFRAIPKKWDSFLRRHVWLEGLRKPLSKYCQGHLLVIEICCHHDSSLKRLCHIRCIPYLGLDQNLDVTSPTARALLQLVKTRQTWIAIHISTPCTAGCGFKHIARENPAAVATWNRHHMRHRVIWRSLKEGLEGFEIRPKVLMSQEWPRNTDLWVDKTYRKISEQIGLRYNCRVDRHAIDGIFKQWIFRTNRSELRDLLLIQSNKTKEECRQVGITESGNYSLSVASHILYGYEKIQFDEDRK